MHPSRIPDAQRQAVIARLNQDDVRHLGLCKAYRYLRDVKHEEICSLSTIFHIFRENVLPLRGRSPREYCNYHPANKKKKDK